MNNKNKNLKKICVFAVLGLIAFKVVYTPANDRTQNKYSDLDISEPLSTTQLCLPNEECYEAVNASIKTNKPSLVSPQPAVINNPMNRTNEAVVNKSSNKSDFNVATKLQGSEIITFHDFMNKDSHQCRMEFNDDSVQQVNQMLDLFSEEMVLYKNSYPVNRFLDLNIISPQLSDQFNERLVYKIKVLLEIYRQSFSVFLDKPIEINLVILPSMSSYVDFVESLSLSSDRSQGKFWASSNFAFVAFKNEQQATEVALHEAIHSLNFSLVGSISRWLDEGLAQLFSGIEIVQENNSNMFTLPSFYSMGNSEPMNFENLIYSEQEQWNLELKSDLYSTSFAFVSYFFDQRKANNILGALLREEGQNPCSVLSNDRYLKTIEDSLYNFRSDFDDWLEVESRKN